MREGYGPQAHAEVLARLPPALSAHYRSQIREASWQSIEDLVAYMEAAKGLLAPDESGFYRRLGRFAGEHDRRQRAVSVMVQDIHTATVMAQTVFRTFFDVGRLEVAGIDAGGAVLRFHDFPMTETWCQRTQGAIEGLVSNDAVAVRVTAGDCVARGAAWCEYRLSFEKR